MKNRIMLIIIMLTILPLVTFSQIVVKDTVTSVSIDRLEVSLTAILANPEKYNGSIFYVSGYLHHRFEDSGIYLSKTDADFLICANALWVSYADTPALKPMMTQNDVRKTVNLNYFDGKMVCLRGRLNTSNRGHMGMFCAELKDVDIVQELRQWYNGQKELWKIDDSGFSPKKPGK